MTNLPKDADGLRIRIIVMDGQVRVGTNHKAVGTEIGKLAPAVLRAAADELERRNKPSENILPRDRLPATA